MGKTNAMDVDFDDKVSDIKAKIEEKYGAPSEIQKLILFGGIILENTRTLFSYNIKEETIIFISFTRQHGI